MLPYGSVLDHINVVHKTAAYKFAHVANVYINESYESVGRGGIMHSYQ